MGAAADKSFLRVPQYPQVGALWDEKVLLLFELFQIKGYKNGSSSCKDKSFLRIILFLLLPAESAFENLHFHISSIVYIFINILFSYFFVNLEIFYFILFLEFNSYIFLYFFINICHISLQAFAPGGGPNMSPFKFASSHVFDFERGNTLWCWKYMCRTPCSDIL